MIATESVVNSFDTILGGGQPAAVRLRGHFGKLGYHLGYHWPENAPDELLVRGVFYLVEVVGPAGIEPAT